MRSLHLARAAADPLCVARRGPAPSHRQGAAGHVVPGPRNRRRTAAWRPGRVAPESAGQPARVSDRAKQDRLFDRGEGAGADLHARPSPRPRRPDPDPERHRRHHLPHARGRGPRVGHGRDDAEAPGDAHPCHQHGGLRHRAGSLHPFRRTAGDTGRGPRRPPPRHRQEPRPADGPGQAGTPRRDGVAGHARPCQGRPRHDRASPRLRATLRPYHRRAPRTLRRVGLPGLAASLADRARQSARGHRRRLRRADVTPAVQGARDRLRGAAPDAGRDARPVQR